MRRGHAAREDRRLKADTLAKARSARSPPEQLRQLDERLGAGVGAMKERAKLSSEIEKAAASREKAHKNRKKVDPDGKQQKQRSTRESKRSRGQRSTKKGDR